jgi:hypothetical protein
VDGDEDTRVARGYLPGAVGAHARTERIALLGSDDARVRADPGLRIEGPLLPGAAGAVGTVGSVPEAASLYRPWASNAQHGASSSSSSNGASAIPT